MQLMNQRIPGLAAVTFALLLIGCQDSSTTGTDAGDGAPTDVFFMTQDNDVARTALLILPEIGAQTICRRAQQPVTEGLEERRTMLSGAARAGLLDLMSDPANAPYYDADYDASVPGQRPVCVQPIGLEEFCYLPAVTAITPDDDFWMFAILPELTLSDQTLALIDAFEVAFDECWANGSVVE